MSTPPTVTARAMSRTEPVDAGALIARLEARTARVGVIGLGYVGLPLAVEFGAAGLHVVAVDVDPAKIEALRQGRS